MKKYRYKLPKDYGIKSLKGKRKYKIYDINTRHYLRNSLKSDKKIKFSDYKIYLTYREDGGYGDFEEVYQDTKYSFILAKFGLKEKICTGKTALACVGFDCNFDNSITIKQIQGVLGKQNDLSPFRWTKMLLKICVDWARDNGFKTVYVIRAEDSAWYRCDKKRSENMFMRYDVTARRSGFKFNKEEKIYYFSLIS